MRQTNKLDEQIDSSKLAAVLVIIANTYKNM